MSRYYFNLYNDEVVIDEEGIELPDDDAARNWARDEVRYQAAEAIKLHAHLVRSHKIVVCNDAAGEIATIAFGDVVAVRD